MRISDWSSDVCSSDLHMRRGWLNNADWHVVGFMRLEHLLELACRYQRIGLIRQKPRKAETRHGGFNARVDGGDGEKRRNCHGLEIGRASCRERVCKYV